MPLLWKMNDVAFSMIHFANEFFPSKFLNLLAVLYEVHTCDCNNSSNLYVTPQSTLLTPACLPSPPIIFLSINLSFRTPQKSLFLKAFCAFLASGTHYLVSVKGWFYILSESVLYYSHFYLFCSSEQAQTAFDFPMHSLCSALFIVWTQQICAIFSRFECLERKPSSIV